MKTKYITHQEGENFVIYDSRLAKKSQSKKRLGFLLLNLSLTGLLLFLIPILIGELKYRTKQISNQPQIKYSRFGQLLALDQKGILSPADWSFSLIIPEIQLNTKVVDMVDISNQTEYEIALKEGVAHAKGTAYPGQEGTIYLFGHSTDYPWNITRYSAYLYPLKYLKENQEIILIYQGKNYDYRVTEKKIASANELEYLTSEDNQARLIIQTCWPPGTAWKRLIVIAKPIRDLTNSIL